MEDEKLSHEFRDEFVRDMQVAGLSSGTQTRYLSSVNGFFRDTWLEPSSVREQDVQSYLIALRERGVRGRRSGAIATHCSFCS